MNLVFKPVETEQDYIDQLEIRNREYRHAPLTLEEALAYDAASPKDLEKRRYLARDERGRAIVRAFIVEERTKEGRHFFTDVAINREHWAPGIWQAGMNHIMGLATGWGATALVATISSARGEVVLEAQRAGFQERMRNPMSCLDVQSFDRRAHCDALQQAELAGAEIISVKQYQDKVGDAWIANMWRLEMDIWRDVPMVIPFDEDPLEAYEAQVRREHYDPSTRFVALIDGQLAGISEIQLHKADIKQATTHLTGTRREFRRRGIATALKVHAIERSRQLGVEHIWTDNEENNPMYQINLKLGFKRGWDWINMRMDLNERA